MAGLGPTTDREQRLVRKIEEKYARHGATGMAERLRSGTVNSTDGKILALLVQKLQAVNSPQTALAEGLRARVQQLLTPTQTPLRQPLTPPVPPGVDAQVTIPMEGPVRRSGKLPQRPLNGNGNGAGGTAEFNQVLSPPPGPRQSETILPEYGQQRPRNLQRPAAMAAHGGLSFQEVAPEQQMGVVELLRKTLIPYAKQLQDRPDAVEHLKKYLLQVPQDVVKGIFANFSAQGRALPVPHHMIGKALILMVQQEQNFRNWVYNGQSERLEWLEDNVRATAADVEAPKVLRGFQDAFLNASQNPQSEEMNKLMVQCRGILNTYTQNARHTLTRMAQLLTEKQELSDAHLVFAMEMIEQCKPLVRSNQMSEEMLSAFSALFRKVSRAKQKAERARKDAQNVQQADALFDAEEDAGFMAALAEIHAQNAQMVKDAQEQPDPLLSFGKSLSGAESAATGHVADLIRNKPQHFVEFYLKAELAHPANRRLHLIPDPECVQNPNTDDIPILGKGGTCVVVRLFDTHLGVPIAVRFDVHGLMSEENAGLALRGIAIHDKLVHPNIARSFGFDTLPLDVVPPGKDFTDKHVRVAVNFQRVELMKDGITMSHVISELCDMNSAIGVPTPDAALTFLYRIANALEFCHGMGVVHRDIKPDNIMIIPPEGWDGKDINKLLKLGKPKLLDFGIARDNATADANFTFAKGGLLGTPHYIAPEGCQDSKDTRNPAGDAYALSMIFYDLLAGKKDFHPMQFSHANNKRVKSLNVEEFNRTEAGWMKYGAVIGSIQPDHDPIISPQDPYLEAFLSQGGPIAQSLVNMVSRMSHPDPQQRPPLEEVLAYAESPLEYSMGRKGAVRSEQPSDNSSLLSGFMGGIRSLFGRK